MELQPVKGMRDFYPDEMSQRMWLFGKFRQTAKRFNFTEYDACVLENEEIYIRKAGDEITNQLYSFEDKGGRRLSLRPELTPSLARMIIARPEDCHLPLRWFSIAQCFRYEKMQRGRKREHYQWNMDIVGEASVAAELELLAAITDLFESLGLTDRDVIIRFNNRNILAELLARAEIPEAKFPEVSVIVDKLEKIGPKSVEALLIEAGIGPSIVDRIMTFTQARDLEDVRKTLGYIPKAETEIRALVEAAQAYGISNYVQFAPSLVRGLSYYTGTVFEAFEASGQGRAICGGGRYDHLLETFGGQPTPMVGFGFGDVVISLILSEKGLLPSLCRDGKVLVAAFSSVEAKAAIKTAKLLRNLNLHTELDLSFPKLKKLLIRADRQRFTYVVFVAPDELKDGNVFIKDLRTGIDERMSLESAPPMIKSRIQGDITNRWS